MTNQPGSTRRDFLHAGAASLAALALPEVVSASQAAKNSGGIPLRPLGKTGQKVSLICLGGFHQAVHKDEAESLRLVQRAVDEGITFLDNAWDYHDGVAEERMGKALEQSKLHDKVFLMTKVCGRDAKTATQHLEDSLRRLRTDHIDLWQFHEINYDNDPDWIFAEDGAIHAALKAREQGKVRFIGFTGHKDPDIHLKMLGMPFEWDSVQMPVNVMDGTYRSFEKRVLPVLNERGIGSIGMKSLGGNGKIVTEGGVTIEEALRYVFSLPVSTVVSGIDSEKILEQNLKIVREFVPMTAEEIQAIHQRTKLVAGDGRFELFKSSQIYDGPYHRKQHGFAVETA